MKEISQEFPSLFLFTYLEDRKGWKTDKKNNGKKPRDFSYQERRKTKTMQIFSSSQNMAKLKITVGRRTPNNGDWQKNGKCWELFYVSCHALRLARMESIVGKTQICLSTEEKFSKDFKLHQRILVLLLLSEKSSIEMRQVLLDAWFNHLWIKIFWIRVVSVIFLLWAFCAEQTCTATTHVDIKAIWILSFLCFHIKRRLSAEVGRNGNVF